MTEDFHIASSMIPQTSFFEEVITWFWILHRGSFVLKYVTLAKSKKLKLINI